MSVSEDRNFDPITEHFVKKVYGGLKGDIRLAVLKRDLTDVVKQLSAQHNRPLRILDVGAGLAQISIELAEQGHQVTINDISHNMLVEAKKNASERGVLDKISWLVCPYQHFEEILGETADEGYDLILCHALLEWLGQPSDIMPFFARWLAADGVLSLCFYNPASFVYRNLIMGNFNLLNNPEFKSDNKKSLTPNNPVSYEQVAGWLEDQGLQINSVSGLRVFHDYSPLKRGGHTNPEAVIKMELRYSNQTPYKWLGRYLHVLAQRQQ
ncbi:methyltransferase domain-containing protein [Psychrobacter sp. FDAARGOS_221]|uniref:methyltransferase domain-containing protein n=1 Tax=Psychrobacter sp. FDAARGOS_221 TaxID=1975705 RepID=UPI000BB54A21|nr:methyltransferase domain-containing protein [Psychrobacter sp. FDAARGOS_221]PNK61634.1 methyltransferase domain-containing protein [Psychrobacter sp. FDAARGOS_221]